MKFAINSLLALVVTSSSLAANWETKRGKNESGPGDQLDIFQSGKPVARFIFGKGQKKPFLHILGRDGELLTNPGVDENGKDAGKYPHHRGIYIGWNKIESDLGNRDLWHLNKGEWITVKEVKTSTTDNGAKLVATIEWLASQKDDSASQLLISETRTLSISRIADGATQVDAHFSLKAARDLRLNGDLQHAGIHFRANTSVANREKDTSYLSDPADKSTKGPDWQPGGKSKKDENIKRGQLKWARLLFPIGDNWYSAMEMNSPKNPSAELSWRSYGRFGFFFKKDLTKDETLEIDYRFIITPEKAPAEKTTLSGAQVNEASKRCVAHWTRFLKDLAHE